MQSDSTAFPDFDSTLGFTSIKKVEMFTRGFQPRTDYDEDLHWILKLPHFSNNTTLSVIVILMLQYLPKNSQIRFT